MADSQYYHDCEKYKLLSSFNFSTWRSGNVRFFSNQVAWSEVNRAAVKTNPQQRRSRVSDNGRSCTRALYKKRIDAKLLYWSRVALHQELQCGAGSEQKKSFGMKMCEKEIQLKNPPKKLWNQVGGRHPDLQLRLFKALLMLARSRVRIANSANHHRSAASVNADKSIQRRLIVVLSL